MAYNVLKGNVQFINSDSGSIESMVDDYSNQSITGSKDFLTLTGSNVYVKNNLGIGTTQPETKMHIQSGSAGTVATTDGALLTLESSGKPKIHFQSPNAYGGSIIFGSVADNDEGQIDYDHGSDRFLFKTAGSTRMTILGDNVGINTTNPTEKLEVNGNIKASGIISGSGAISGSSFHGAFHGAGAGLTGISAASLNLGDTLSNDSGALIVDLSNSAGLESTATGLKVNPSLAAQKTSPVNADKFVIADSAASNATKYITYENLSTGITSAITTFPPNGSDGNVQIKNGSAFQGPNELNFNTSTNILTVTGKMTASVHVSSSQVFATSFHGDGSNLTGLASNVYNSFTANYTVATNHDLMGIVTTGSAITASLAAASSYGSGQRFTFKDVSGSCSGSNHIVISASLHHTGDRIDGQGIVKIQAGYGAITLASDGVKSFYIVSTS
tara:strand:- start:1356 stop:2687 length:1332 start_codon:yes stop_codon:yes gene_type:complete